MSATPISGKLAIYGWALTNPYNYYQKIKTRRFWNPNDHTDMFWLLHKKQVDGNDRFLAKPALVTGIGVLNKYLQSEQS